MGKCTYHKSRVFIPTERKAEEGEEGEEKKKKYSIDCVKFPKLLQKNEKIFILGTESIYEYGLLEENGINGLMNGWTDRPKDREKERQMVEAEKKERGTEEIFFSSCFNDGCFAL